jgi:CRP/FNR family transcriptional regulator, cyclic AMP receptor protein
MYCSQAQNPTSIRTSNVKPPARPSPRIAASTWKVLSRVAQPEGESARGQRRTSSPKSKLVKTGGIPDILQAASADCKLAFSAGEVLFHQGDVADAVYYVASGKIQITVVSKQGKEGVIVTLAEGAFLGECSLTEQATYLSTATAAAQSTVTRIPRDAMAAMIRENPALADRFMTYLLGRALQVEADLVDHLFNSSEKRLARLLLLLAHFDGDGKLQVIPKISQEVLAQRVGTTRSRINFFMNKFRRLGLIDYDGGAVTVSSGLLNLVVRD